MIAEISTPGELFEAALLYNFKKYEEKVAEVLFSQKLPVTSEGEYIYKDVLHRFHLLIPSCNRVKKTVFHCSLNPHPDDKLSDEQLTQIAKEYMEKLGYGKQPYIVFKHNDIARKHIHIVSSRVTLKGEKITDKFEHVRSEKIIRDMELKNNLIPTQKKGKEKNVLQSSILPVTLYSGNVKEQITATLQEVMKHYKFQSLGELNAILKKYNIECQETKMAYAGKTYDGIVYVPLHDETKERASLPFPGNELGREMRIDAIRRHFESSRETIKKESLKLKKQILEIKNKIDIRDKNRFAEELEKSKIRVIFRENEEGRIYGVTFVDDDSGVTVNGSRLGTDFSAKNWNDFFNHSVENRMSPTEIPSGVSANLPEQFYEIEEEDLLEIHGKNRTNESLIGGDTEHYADQAFHRKLKKKKRKIILKDN